MPVLLLARKWQLVRHQRPSTRHASSWNRRPALSGACSSDAAVGGRAIHCRVGQRGIGQLHSVEKIIQRRICAALGWVPVGSPTLPALPPVISLFWQSAQAASNALNLSKSRCNLTNLASNQVLHMAMFPVFLPVSREPTIETRSQTTASTAIKV
jgi:hypothetical protein